MGGAQGPNAGKDATAVMRLRQVILLIGTARPRSSLRAARSMKLSGVCPSVRRSSVTVPQSTAAAVAGGFAVQRHAGRIYQWRAPAPRSNWRHAQQQQGRSKAQSSKCGQCHVDSRGTRLNTDLSCFLTK